MRFSGIAFKCMTSWDCLCLFMVQFLTLQLAKDFFQQKALKAHRSPNSLSSGTGSLPTKTVSLRGNESKVRLSLL